VSSYLPISDGPWLGDRSTFICRQLRLTQEPSQYSIALTVAVRGKSESLAEQTWHLRLIIRIRSRNRVIRTEPSAANFALHQMTERTVFLFRGARLLPLRLLTCPTHHRKRMVAARNSRHEVEKLQASACEIPTPSRSYFAMDSSRKIILRQQRRSGRLSLFTRANCVESASGSACDARVNRPT
jgi:hypothetical protein